MFKTDHFPIFEDCIYCLNQTWVHSLFDKISLIGTRPWPRVSITAQNCSPAPRWWGSWSRENLGCFQSSSLQKRVVKHREGKAPQCCWEAFLEEKPAVFLGQSHHLGTKEKENRKGDREERTGKGWEEWKTKGKKLKGKVKRMIKRFLWSFFPR